MLLKQIGTDNGDKHLHGNIPNMKRGEYRYYPQDNLNLKFAKNKHITREKFVPKLKKYFPEYIISPKEIDCYDESDEEYYIGSIGIMKGEHYMPIVINKGYICFEEASETKNGTVYYIHNGVLFVYEELFIK